MRRLPLILLLLVALAPGTWIRSPKPKLSYDPRVAIHDLMPEILRDGPLPQIGLGVRLAGAWQLSGRHRDFGSYSALGQLPDGTMLAVSDKDGALFFPLPDKPGPWKARIAVPVLGNHITRRAGADFEALAIEPGGKAVWLAAENADAFYRYAPDFSSRTLIPAPELREWPRNSGPEAMARLSNGRFVVIGETFVSALQRGLHPAFLFAQAPQPFEQPLRFVVRTPDGYRPTDAAQLPDGRLVILTRKFTLLGFRSKLLLADPAAIRAGQILPTQEIGAIADRRIRDNYEGLAVVPEGPGQVALWLITDDNEAAFVQRSLLIKLEMETGRASAPPR